MAEQDTHQHTAEVRDEEMLSTNMMQVSASDEHKQEETFIAPNVTQQLSEDSSAATNGETNVGNSAELEQADVKTTDDGLAEETVVPLTEGSPSLDKACSPPQDDDGSHGDYNREPAGTEQPTAKGEDISRDCHAGEKKAPETPAPLTPGVREEDRVDGPEARPQQETSGNNKSNADAGENEVNCLRTDLAPKEEDDMQEDTASPEEISAEDGIDGQRNTIETIGPTTEDATEPTDPVVSGGLRGSRRYLLAVGVAVVVAIVVQHLLQPESPPQKKDVQQIDIFLKQMDKLKTQFPNQRAELWARSRIHMLRHLQTAQPTEPVSLILTAGLGAERTLHCMAQGLAAAFSLALNASILHIDGASKASQDSDQVKLDLDSKLQEAFEGDKPVAVIHRFEELPPGSTLIFYRYCDHENAAYKKTCLIFTVLLEDEEETLAKSHLSSVEEMVDDHLQKKFLSSGHPVSFDRMDLDKYGGLWSRISHLILPVAADERIEHEGCQGT